MTELGEHAGRVLSRFGELEWFRSSALTHPVYGYQQVPHLGFRFREPREEIAGLIREVLRDFTGRVEWTLDTTRKNWLLVPTAVMARENEADAKWFSNALVDMVSDQEFCLSALSDLREIIEMLRSAAPLC